MADNTALQESSQALFCSIADNLGSSGAAKILNLAIFPSFISFKTNKDNARLIEKSAERICTPGVKLVDIENFLITHNDWYVSSVLIANKLVNELDKISAHFNIKSAGYQNIYYFRGDDSIMGTIFKLFTIANNSPSHKWINQVRFGNVNKWNPADIYLASKTAHGSLSEILKEASKSPGVFTFVKLNSELMKLMCDGNLLPLSLKKTKQNVILKKVNFNRTEEIEYLSGISYSHVTSWKPYVKVVWPMIGNTRDMQIILTNKGSIKIRHDPSANRLVIELIEGAGASAKAGSIGSVKIFCELLSLVDKTTASRILNAYQSGDLEYKKQMKLITPHRSALEKNKRSGESQFDFERGQISAIEIINRIMPIIKIWFDDSSNQTNIDNFLRILFEYVTSRTELSGPFVIAK